MIVDLHAHYPMHLLPEAPGDPFKLLSEGHEGDRWRDRANEAHVRLASRFANYESFSSGPGVTVQRMTPEEWDRASGLVTRSRLD